MKTSKGAKAFRDNHWGISHHQEISTNTPDLDRHLKKHQPSDLRQPELTEWGRLCAFGFIPQAKMNPNGKGPIEHIQIADQEIDNNYLAYDPYHSHQRLYFILSPGVRKEMKREFWGTSKAKPEQLAKLARRINGRHGTGDYPSVLVKPIGEMTTVDYFTDKESDGLSIYRHTLGEESGIRPELAVDAKGRLWLIGGDYYSTEAGIIN